MQSDRSRTHGNACPVVIIKSCLQPGTRSRSYRRRRRPARRRQQRTTASSASSLADTARTATTGWPPCNRTEPARRRR